MHLRVPQLERIQRPDLMVARVIAAIEAVDEVRDSLSVEEPVIVAASKRVEHAVLELRPKPRGERDAESVFALLEHFRREERRDYALQDVLCDALPNLERRRDSRGEFDEVVIEQRHA